MTLKDKINYKAEKDFCNNQALFFSENILNFQKIFSELCEKHLALLQRVEEQDILIEKYEKELEELNVLKARKELKQKNSTSPLKDISDGINHPDSESPDFIERTQFSNANRLKTNKVFEKKEKCKIINDTQLSQTRLVPLNTQKILPKNGLSKLNGEVRIDANSTKKVSIQTKLNFKKVEKTDLKTLSSNPNRISQDMFRKTPEKTFNSFFKDISNVFVSDDENDDINLINSHVPKNYHDENKSDSETGDVIESTQQPQKQKRLKTAQRKSNESQDSTFSEFFSAKSRSKSPGMQRNLSVSSDDSPDVINKTLTYEQQRNKHEIAEETYCSISENMLQQQKKKGGVIGERLLANPPSSLLITEPGSLKNKLNLIDVDSDDYRDSDDYYDSDNDIEILTARTKKRSRLDSFDRFPEKKKASPKFAFKGPVIRNKAERAKLPGHECPDCKQYYDNLGLSDEEKAKRLNMCSRHRSKFNERPSSPPGLWNHKFADTNYSSQE